MGVHEDVVVVCNNCSFIQSMNEYFKLLGDHNCVAILTLTSIISISWFRSSMVFHGILFLQGFHFCRKWKIKGFIFCSFNFYCLVPLKYFLGWNVFLPLLYLVLQKMILYLQIWICFLQELQKMLSPFRKWKLWKLLIGKNRKMFSPENHFHFPQKMLCTSIALLLNLLIKS